MKQFIAPELSIILFEAETILASSFIRDENELPLNDFFEE